MMAAATTTTTGVQRPEIDFRQDETFKSTLAALLPLPRSFFLSLTLPALTPATHAQIRSAITGSHLIELRVDLLSPDLHSDPTRFRPYVTEQLHTLRSLVPLPVLFTVRTKSQGGSWPDNDVDGLLRLYKLAINLSVEVLDVEMQLSDEKIEEVVRWARDGGNRTELLMSHHDWSGGISWDGHNTTSEPPSASSQTKHWNHWYTRGARFGDAVKLVGTARTSQDNIALENFRMRVNSADRLSASDPNTVTAELVSKQEMTESRAASQTNARWSGEKIPLCAVNMGLKGQMSRVLNDFLTPVTHEALGRVAAPGQLSVREIEVAARLLGLEGRQAV